MSTEARQKLKAAHEALAAAQAAQGAETEKLNEATAARDAARDKLAALEAEADALAQKQGNDRELIAKETEVSAAKRRLSAAEAQAADSSAMQAHNARVERALAEVRHAAGRVMAQEYSDLVAELEIEAPAVERKRVACVCLLERLLGSRNRNIEGFDRTRGPLGSEDAQERFRQLAFSMGRVGNDAEQHYRGAWEQFAQALIADPDAELQA